MKTTIASLILTASMATGSNIWATPFKERISSRIGSVLNIDSKKCAFDLSEPTNGVAPIHHAKIDPKDIETLKSLWNLIWELLKKKHRSIPYTMKCNGGSDITLSFNFEESVLIQWKQTKSFDVTVFQWENRSIKGIRIYLKPEIDPILNVSPEQETGLNININFLRNTFFAIPIVGDYMESHKYTNDLIPVLERVSKALGAKTNR